MLLMMMIIMMMMMTRMENHNQTAITMTVNDVDAAHDDTRMMIVGYLAFARKCRVPRTWALKI